jgi:hypothetical protein
VKENYEIKLWIKYIVIKYLFFKVSPDEVKYPDEILGRIKMQRKIYHIERLLVLVSLFSMILLLDPISATAQTPIYGGGKNVVGVEVPERVYLDEYIPILIDLSSGWPGGYPHVEYFEGGYTLYEAYVNVTIIDPDNEIVAEWDIMLYSDLIELDGWKKLGPDLYGIKWEVPEVEVKGWGIDWRGRFAGLYRVHVTVEEKRTEVYYEPPETWVFYTTKSSMDSFKAGIRRDVSFSLAIDFPDTILPGEKMTIDIAYALSGWPFIWVLDPYDLDIFLSIYYPNGTLFKEMDEELNFSIGFLQLELELAPDAPTGRYLIKVIGSFRYKMPLIFTYIKDETLIASFHVTTLEEDKTLVALTLFNNTYQRLLAELEEVKALYEEMQSNYTSLKDDYEELKWQSEIRIRHIMNLKTITYALIVMLIIFGSISTYFMRKMFKLR